MTLPNPLPELLDSLPPLVQAYLAQLQTALLGCFQTIASQEVQIQQQVQDLQQCLAQNSQNSSKPPSSDPPWQSSPAKPKTNSGKKQGGQKGRPKHQRELVPVEKVDRVQKWYPLTCERCQGQLGVSEQQGEPRRHQVWEIGLVPATVTEQQLYSCACSSCGHITAPPHPVAVPSRQFGPQLMATVATLHGRYRLSTHEVQAIVRDLWGVDSCRKVSGALEAGYSQVQAAVQASEQANVDEYHATSTTAFLQKYELHPCS